MSNNMILNITVLKEEMKLNLVVENTKTFRELADLIFKKFAVNKESEEPYLIYMGELIDINSNDRISKLFNRENISLQLVIGAEVLGGKKYIKNKI